MSKILKLVVLLTSITTCSFGQKDSTEFKKFRKVNNAVIRLFQDGETHKISGFIDSTSYKTKWKRRHFLFNGRFLDWRYDEYLEAYDIIGEAYIRDLEPGEAKRFTKKILVLDPEYFYFNKGSSQKYLLKRFTGLRFTLGFYGIGALTFAKLGNEKHRMPDGAIAANEDLKVGKGFKSSFFGGVELIRNPAIKSRLRSIDLYLEYMFHTDRFKHEVTTRFPQGSGTPSFVMNEITERHDWQSLLIYPRVRLNTKKDKKTLILFGGIGFNYLKSGDFFEVNQQTSEIQSQELSPVKLYKKENMRNNSNTSILFGFGYDYRITRNITLNFQARYLTMLNNIVTDFSIEERPLQDSPIYYVDNDILMSQISGSIGLSVNIGTSPSWLGF